jgi:hypothetical protein
MQYGFAQQPVVSKVKNVSYKSQVTAGPAIPFGGFSETHFGGITASYIRKQHNHRVKETLHPKKTDWLAAVSFSHFLGKKENIGAASYRYKNYSLLELNGGIAWYPVSKLDLSFRTGPALGYYNKVFRFTLNGQLQGSYRIGPKTNITPGLSFVKEPGSDALWISSLQLGLLF